MTFSERNLDIKLPPKTARPVADAWAAVAPRATAYGFNAALSALKDSIKVKL